MKPKVKVRSNRINRHYRIRNRLAGTAERPRLSIYPSLKHIEAQLVNDFDHKTLVGCSTKDKDFQKSSKMDHWGNVAAAEKFGGFVAAKAKEKGIERVVFDRGGYLYHGRVKAFADAARAGGLQF